MDVEHLTPTPLTVIGAGPAGIMAASVAAAAGVPVTLIDDAALPGIQTFRQPPSRSSIVAPAAHAGHPESVADAARLSHPLIRTLHNHCVWGVFEDRVLALADDVRTYALPVARVVIAAAAYDRPLAFPGWTLPGVVGTSDALHMLKTQGQRPGRRVLLAGLGPLQLALADALLAAGVELVCVADASDPVAARSALAAVTGHWPHMRAAAASLRAMRRRGVPYLVQHAIIAAAGNEHITGATLARLDAGGVPIAGSERHFEVDAICLGYGLLPSFQVAAAFGCELRFDPDIRWWRPSCDEWLQTSEPGIFVAGDLLGIGGAKVAALEGQVAGLSAAHQLGYLDASAVEARLAPLMSELNRHNRLVAALNQIYALPAGLALLARDDTILCRCEAVSQQAVKRAVALGGTDLHQLKLRTRAGMGWCQGRNCSALLAPLIASQSGQQLSALRPFTVRPPLQPVPLGILAGGAGAPEPD